MEIFKAETLTTVCSKQRLYVVLRSELRLLWQDSGEKKRECKEIQKAGDMVRPGNRGQPKKAMMSDL